MPVALREKRCFPRVKLNMPLRYHTRGLPEYNNTLCEDISLGGVRFINDKFIRPEASLALEINVLTRALNPIGRVAWSQPLPHSDRYRVGVEFLELDLGEKNYLSDYIDMQRHTI
jgi:hypothetical protein